MKRIAKTSSKMASCSIRKQYEEVLCAAKEIGILRIGGWSIESAVKHLVNVEPKFKNWIECVGIPKIYEEPRDESCTHFASLVRTITFQQVSVAAGKSILEKVLTALECSLNTLSPEIVRDANYGVKLVDGKNMQTINGKPCGLSESKARYLRSLSAHFIRESLEAKLDTLSEKEVCEKLIAVDGLGNWSVHMFLLFKLQRQNVLALSDLGVKKGIAKMYGLSPATWKKMKEAQFLDLVKHWQPYGSLACTLMWRADEVEAEAEPQRVLEEAPRGKKRKAEESISSTVRSATADGKRVRVE